ncbi:MAG TPA: DUF3810 family protein, partial [Planctomycetes bacterium]|nr:DUF3810 family protein [Planctomycetota bacterium]
RGPRPFFLNPWAWFFLFLGAAHVWAAHRLPSSWVDGFYHKALYPWILRVLGGTCDRFSWSLSGGLFLFGALLFLFRFLELLSTAFRRGFALRCLAASFRLLVVLSLLVHPFFLFWGYHYRATPLARLLELEGIPGRGGADRLFRRARVLADRLREPGLDTRSGPLPPLSGEVRRALRELGLGDLPLPRRVKNPPIPGMLLLSGTLGITSPFTLEAHVEPSLHWADQPFLGAHELAHLGGVAVEGEANFVAWYALVTAKHPLYRYCGWLGLLLHAPAPAPGNRLPAPVAGDLRGILERRSRGRIGWLAWFSRSVYDSYLKGQGVRRGIADYDRLAVLAARYSILHPEILR